MWTGGHSHSIKLRTKDEMGITTVRAGRTLDVASSPQPRHGLHGHCFGANTVTTAVAEAVGTFFLTLTIIAVAISASLGKPVAGSPYGSVAVALGGGFVLAATVAGFGPVSGAHFNPAVTVGLAVNRRCPWRYVPGYLAAQLAGGIGAALVAWAVFGPPARSIAHLGATSPAPGVSAGGVLAIEAIVTFLFVVVVTSVATNPKVAAPATSLSIGLGLCASILIAGPVSGAAVNPARALGPMIVSATFTDWWAYLLGPVVGGVAAVAFYDHVLRLASPPDASPQRS